MSKKRFEAWRSADLFEIGLGAVVVSRQKTGGVNDMITAGIFLVDVFCLGVKDAYQVKIPALVWDDALDRIFLGESLSLSPACAKKLIEGAIAYARSVGFNPASNYANASHILADFDARQCDTVFTFGKNGKPFYIQGPNDSPELIERAVATLGPQASETYLIEDYLEDEEDEEDEEAQQPTTEKKPGNEGREG